MMEYKTDSFALTVGCRIKSDVGMFMELGTGTAAIVDDRRISSVLWMALVVYKWVWEKRFQNLLRTSE